MGVTVRTTLIDSVLEAWSKTIQIESCVDIGGSGGTDWLARNFPHVTHHLIDVKPESGELHEYKRMGVDAKYYEVDASKDIDGLGLSAMSNYLLKIDVDGPELSVIENSPQTVRNASMLICEATTWTISARLSFIESMGLKLVEIGGPCYYYNRLWQVELVFVREDLYPDWPFEGNTCDRRYYQCADDHRSTNCSQSHAG